MLIALSFISAGWAADIREHIAEPVVLVDVNLTADKPPLKDLVRNLRPIRGRGLLR